VQQPRGIKGITDNPRPPVVAKAKIGRMVEHMRADGTVVQKPEKLDHIIFVEPQTGNEIEAFRALGSEPQSFLAVFPPDAESTLDAAWKRYGKLGLKCRGDGEVGIDRETGEERQCAGDYNKDHPEQHLCSFARPTVKGNKTYPPECKPTLSMRLVVPLAGALGLVQLDTGGVSSSVPTLWWQIEQLKSYAGGELGGVAVKVSIRPFTTRHGVSFAWNLSTPSEDELALLRRQFAEIVPVRVIGEGAIPRALEAAPPMEETPDADIYGEQPEEEINPSNVEVVEDPEPLPEEPEPLNAEPAETPDIGVPGEVVAAELAYKQALKASVWAEAKQASKIALMEANRGKAEAEGKWSSYVDWLLASTEQVPVKS
jgi:hypothetical protein